MHSFTLYLFIYLILAEHISFGDAVEQRVGDLTGSARHQHTDRFGLRLGRGTTQQSTTKHSNLLPLGPEKLQVVQQLKLSQLDTLERKAAEKFEAYQVIKTYI